MATTRASGRRGLSTGFTIDDPRRCGEILDEVSATPGPVIVEGVVDPLEPPMPAKVTAKQGLHFAESLVCGEPNRQKIALIVLGNRVRELL